MVAESIGHVRYINIVTWLRGFQVKPLYLVLFSLYLSLFWELRDRGNLKNLQFLPESLGAILEYWYIERGLSRHAPKMWYFENWSLIAVTPEILTMPQNRNYNEVPARVFAFNSSIIFTKFFNFFFVFAHQASLRQWKANIWGLNNMVWRHTRRTW